MPHSHGLLHHLTHNFDGALEVEALTKHRPEGGPPTKAKQKPKPVRAPVVQPKPCGNSTTPVEAAGPCGHSKALWERRPRRERQAKPAQKAPKHRPEGGPPTQKQAGKACPKSPKHRPEGGPPTKAKQKPKPAPAPVVQPKPCGKSKTPVEAAGPCGHSKAPVGAAPPPRKAGKACPKAQSIAPRSGLPQNRKPGQVPGPGPGPNYMTKERPVLPTPVPETSCARQCRFLGG